MGSKAERTRERILDAAAKVLSERGYARMRLSDVATEAGLQTAAIYYHFPSRDDLVEEVMWVGAVSVTRHVHEAVEALPADASGLDRVMTAVEAHLRYELQISDYATASIRNAQNLPEELWARTAAERKSYSRFWRTLFTDGIERGEFRPGLHVGMSRMLMLGALNWVPEWWRTDEGSLEDLIAAAQDMVRRSIMP